MKTKTLGPNTQPPEKLTIGRLAQVADVGVETIRYYERRGLIQQPRATSGAFRVYPEETIRRVHFIRRAKELGFTLNEIADLLGLAGKPTADRASLKAYTGQKIEDIEQKIRDLTAIKNTLEELMKACSGRGPLAGCPIMDALQSIPETQVQKQPHTQTQTKNSRNHKHCGGDQR